MAPIPVTNTPRWKVSYTVGGFAHQFLVRLSPEFVEATAVSEIGAWLLANTSLFWASVVTKVEQAEQGSNLFFPIDTTLDGFAWGGGANSVGNNPLQLNYVGRSPGGRRCRVGLFGYKGAFSEWKLTPAEVAAVGTAVTALNSATSAFYAIDGFPPVWYPYADVGVNDYWVRQSRKTG